MYIIHIVLAGLMTDGASYQENLLSKYHQRLGHKVAIITFQWTMGKYGQPVVDKRSQYVNDDGVLVFRLPMRGEENFNKKFKRASGLSDLLKRERPDVLFVHGCQFSDADVIAHYAKYNNVIVYVDNHADYSNSANNFLSREILHKKIWKRKAQMLVPITKRFYGVLPARVDFLHDIYGIPLEKCSLLLMGADDEEISSKLISHRRTVYRNQLNLGDDDFLVVTGGKIDKSKIQTLLLAEAIHNLGVEKVKLVVFGSIDPLLEKAFFSLCDNCSVRYVGWANNEEAYGYFSASDLVVFPGRHSVYWEQAAAVGKPLLVKWWQGTDHIDKGGNVRFLFEDSLFEIQSELERLIDNPQYYKSMCEKAEMARNSFSYKTIAQCSLL